MPNLINDIREVWDQNLDQEILLMEFVMRRYTMISFDTEYPGFLITKHPARRVRVEDIRRPKIQHRPIKPDTIWFHVV